MDKNQFMEYEQAYQDYLNNEYYKYCSLPLVFGKVEIFKYYLLKVHKYYTKNDKN